MSNIPNAKVSPRIEHGVLKWYEGDTFELSIELDMQTQYESPITIKDTDIVTVVFYDDIGKTVREFSFTTIQDNIITMGFNEDISALFPCGKYTYDIFLQDEESRKTLAKNNPVYVKGGDFYE